jgi:hypothetical protein
MSPPLLDWEPVGTSMPQLARTAKWLRVRFAILTWFLSHSASRSRIETPLAALIFITTTRGTMPFATSLGALDLILNSPPPTISGDGSRTLFGRSWDGRLLCWDKGGPSLQRIAGRADQPVVLFAGQETGSLALEQEFGERRLAREIQQLSGKRLCPVLRRKRRTNHFTRR